MTNLTIGRTLVDVIKNDNAILLELDSLSTL